MELAKPAFPALPQAKEDSEVSGSSGPGPPHTPGPRPRRGFPSQPRWPRGASRAPFRGIPAGIRGRPRFRVPPCDHRPHPPCPARCRELPASPWHSPGPSASPLPAAPGLEVSHYPGLLRALSNTALSTRRDGAATISPPSRSGSGARWLHPFWLLPTHRALFVCPSLFCHPPSGVPVLLWLPVGAASALPPCPSELSLPSFPPELGRVLRADISTLFRSQGCLRDEDRWQ